MPTAEPTPSPCGRSAHVRGACDGIHAPTGDPAGRDASATRFPATPSTRATTRRPQQHTDQQGEPRPVTPGKPPLQLARREPTPGNGQLVANNAYLDILACPSAPRQPRPGQQLPHHNIDQLQHHERRPSHAAQVIGTYRLAKSAVLVSLSLKRNPGTRTACRPRCRGLEFTPLGGALVLRIFEDGGCSMYVTGYRRLPP